MQKVPEQTTFALDVLPDQPYVLLHPSKLAALHNNYITYTLAMHLDLSDSTLTDLYEYIKHNTIICPREHLLHKGYTIIIPQPTSTLYPARSKYIPKQKLALRSVKIDSSFDL